MHRSRALVAALGLLATVILSSVPAGAQNPAYSFAVGLGSTGNDYARDIALDANGNLYVTGDFQGTVDFDPGVGVANLTAITPIQNGSGTDMFVASYDAAGNYRWAFNVGGTPPSGTGGWTAGTSIVVDGSGNLVVSGQFSGTVDFDPGAATATRASAGRVSFVAKYGPTGNYLWAFSIGAYSNRSDVAVDASDNVIVVGNFSGTNDFDPGSGTANLSSTKVSTKRGAASSLDIFVAKYSTTGAYQWAFRLGNVSADDADAVDVDASGNIYVTGQFQSTTVDFNPGSGTASLSMGGFVAKYTGAGGYAWAFRLASDVYQTWKDIAVDANAGLVVSGNFSGTADFDPGTGTASLSATGTGYSIYVARYTTAGAYQWAFSPATGDQHGLSIDGNGDIYLVGYFKGVNDFDPGTGTAVLPTDAVYDVAGYIASYTAGGLHRWSFSIPGTVHGEGIAANGSGDAFVAGGFGATSLPSADFDPSVATASLITAGLRDIFIAKYTEVVLPKRSSDAADIAENGLELRAAPNPFLDDVTLRVAGGTSPVRIEVLDITGRLIETRTVSGSTDVTLGADLPPGVYLVRSTQGEIHRQVLVRKIR